MLLMIWTTGPMSYLVLLSLLPLYHQRLHETVEQLNSLALETTSRFSYSASSPRKHKLWLRRHSSYRVDGFGGIIGRRLVKCRVF